MKTLVIAAFAVGLFSQPAALPELIFSPSHGTGPTAKFWIRTAAPLIVLIVNTILNGDNSCYGIYAPATADTATYNDAAGDWLGDGLRCRFRATKGPAAGWGQVTIEFVTGGVWDGEKNIYVMERWDGWTGPGPPPVSEWYRAGHWTVKTENVPALPLTAPIARPIVPAYALLVPAGTGYTLPTWTVLLITRNGMAQAPGLDYNVAGAIMQPTIGPWGTDDVVAAFGIR